jgi:HD-GYP domain-containing protein (c-di-GMP phosphodiesterase class II)/CheY-like chemotaxis protein
MLKILILEDDPELHDRIAFILESVPGVILEKAYDRKHAIELVNRHGGKIDLLIVDYHLGPISSLGELQRVSAHIDVIFCVDDQRTQPLSPGWKIFATIERNFIASLLLLSVEKWKFAHLSQQQEAIDPNAYCRIKTKLLIDVSPLGADIYARLSESKYIKVFREKDVFDSNDLNRYAQEKKIEYMYLRVSDCGDFVRKYIAFIEEMVRKNKPISIDEITFMHISIHESVQEMTEKLGFSREIQALTKSQIQLTVKTMGRKPILKNILRKLEERTGQYITDHSFLTGYLACGIASQMEWNSEATYYKLMLASFLHDITITDNALASCETIAEATLLGVSDEALSQYKKHPLRVADMIKQMNDIPADVDSIVMQHHELPGGGGFPRGVTSTYISPLSAIFIVSHHMAKAILIDKSRFDLKGHIRATSENWHQAQFKKILNAAEALVL